MTIFGKVLLGIILVVAAVFIVKSAVKKDEVETRDSSEISNEVSNEPSEDEASFNGSAQELMARGGNHKCTFAQEVENSKSTGTVYISDKKMRGDFNIQVLAGGSNMNIESHMISDGEFIYSWSSAMPTGFKIKIDQTAQASSGQQNFDVSQKLDYDCSPWTADASMFILPASINFTAVNS